MRNFKLNNQEVFIKLRNYLKTHNITVKSDYSNSELPHVGPGSYNGVEGGYFNSVGNHFNVSEKAIENAFPVDIDGFTFSFNHFSDYEMEYGNDRSWDASFGFTVTKDGINVIKH